MQPIKLEVRGLGHVPSFKNKKRAILDRHTGKMRTMTDAKTQNWMTRCIQSLKCQLLLEYQTKEGGMQTVPCPLSWIASRIPEDDSCRDIPRLEIDVVHVSKGEEGATITIEQIC